MLNHTDKHLVKIGCNNARLLLETMVLWMYTCCDKTNLVADTSMYLRHESIIEHIPMLTLNKNIFQIKNCNYRILFRGHTKMSHFSMHKIIIKE